MMKNGIIPKVVLTIFLIAAFLFLLFWGILYFVLVVGTDDTISKREIFSMVTDNQAYLEAYIVAEDFSEVPDLDGVKSVRVDGDSVSFSCGGSGLGSATFYCGFYYSENDDLYGVWCAPPHSSVLKPVENGYLYEEANGDNRYYTEHICGHFYFYEASF